MMALEEYLVPAGTRTNICFDCQRACGGCSWSRNFEPVLGWEAKPSKLHSAGGRKREVWGYHITACPLFLRDARRNRS